MIFTERFLQLSHFSASFLGYQDGSGLSGPQKEELKDLDSGSVGWDMMGPKEPENRQIALEGSKKLKDHKGPAFFSHLTLVAENRQVQSCGVAGSE